jgi:hypothetical protein
VNAIAGPSNTTRDDDRPAHPVDTHHDNSNSNTGETELAPVTTPVPANAIAGLSNTTNGGEPPAHSLPITAKKTNAKAAKDRHKN